MKGRLRRVTRHLAPVSVAATTESVVTESVPEAAPRTLLGDADVAKFLASGFLPIPVDDLEEDIQTRLYAKAESNTPEKGGIGGGWLGNNCLPMLPELRDVFLTSGRVGGALQSLLGKDFVINNHRHMHHSSVTSEQSMHKVRCKRRFFALICRSTRQPGAWQRSLRPANGLAFCRTSSAGRPSTTACAP